LRHLGGKAPYLPVHYGFDEYLGLPYSNDMGPVDYDGKPIKDTTKPHAKYPPLPLLEVDWSIGEMMKTLKDAGIDQHTMVVLTSDNGPWLTFGDHAGNAGGLREGKGSSWEGGQREPCIMRWPGTIPAG